MSFVHLHLHSEYSLLDGACRISDLVKSVKQKGQNAVAVTDHGNMYSTLFFYNEAKKQGIKAIIGCEAYVAGRTRFDKTSADGKPFHLVLLCKNMQGYRNLSKIISLAWTEGFYKKPRIDDELLEKYHEGLICLSACLAGEIPSLINSGDIKSAYEKASYYKKIFGDGNFFLEVQDHNIPEQKKVNEVLIKMSRELDIPLVATNDCHYIDRSDASMHDVLLCIQTGKKIDDTDRLKFPSNEFYVKTEEEMRSLFPNIPEAIENTQKIADCCNLEFQSKKTELPHFKTPTGESNFDYFKRLCTEGLKKHYGENPSEDLIERLNHELSVIEKMGFVDYYLIVSDFINYAKSKDIPVGPGRGSGAGSLAAYCIGITNIDPIKYNLIFERFLNPERVSMPDFDIDFCVRRRQEVIEYVRRKYGSDHIAQIIAFGTLAAKGAVRDVGRVMGISLSTVNKISSEITSSNADTLYDAIKTSSELKNLYQEDSEIRTLLDTARKIEGMPRNPTTHAAGVVITERPVDEYVPLAVNNEVVVTQYTKDIVESQGLLKIDFLALRNLTVLDDAKKLIQQTNPNFSDDDIDYTDKAVFDMISEGRTEGVFQFESAGMKNTIMLIKPKSVEDLTAITALYRPGPMAFIDVYRKNRENPQKIKYKHPMLKNILDVTYGCIVYQEQVMQIFRELAGYSFGQADIVRRAMAKKHKDELDAEKQKFIDGCIERGISENTAVSIFADMESFASYAFNKSHAAAYSEISFQTAWYKYHYPKEYMAALLTSILDDNKSLAPYMDECRRLSITIMPPHINYSEYGFSVSGNNMYYGLKAIKNTGSQIINAIIEERKLNGAYSSFIDFCERLSGRHLNMANIESLIKAGAFDGLGLNRRQLIMSAKNIVQSIEYDSKFKAEGQFSFFDDLEEDKEKSYNIPDVPEYSHADILGMEKEVTGLFLSGHPLDEYRRFIDSVPHELIAEIEEYPQKYKSKKLHIIAYILEVKTLTTKKGDLMAFAQIEDTSGSAELIIFPSVFEQTRIFMHEGEVIDLYAYMNEDDEKLKLKLDSALKAVTEPKLKIPEKPSAPKSPRLYLKFSSKDSRESSYATKLLDVFDGRTPVSFYYEDEKKYDHFGNLFKVSLNDVMLNELERVLGSSNVVVGNDNPNIK